MDVGARYDRYDTQVYDRIKTEGINAMMPNVQLHRELMWVLQHRIRVELAENRFEDAMRSLQTGLRISKDVGESPSLIQILVGVAMQAINLKEVEEWVSRPGSPNLYWALSALPRPFLDPRPGVEGEAFFFETMFPNLKEFEKGPLSETRANELLGNVFKDISRLGGGLDPMPDTGTLEKIAQTVGLPLLVATQYPAAKAFLLADGMPADVVARTPPAQAVALKSIRLVRQMQDDMRKGFLLPYRPGRAEFEKQFRDMKAAEVKSCGRRPVPNHLARAAGDGQGSHCSRPGRAEDRGVAGGRGDTDAHGGPRW